MKRKKLFFFVLFSLIILIQSFYWLFANSAQPFILGMPFSMFFIVLFIAVEFGALIALYFIESNELKK